MHSFLMAMSMECCSYTYYRLCPLANTYPHATQHATLLVLSCYLTMPTNSQYLPTHTRPNTILVLSHCYPATNPGLAIHQSEVTNESRSHPLSLAFHRAATSGGPHPSRYSAPASTGADLHRLRPSSTALTGCPLPARARRRCTPRLVRSAAGNPTAPRPPL